MTRKARVALILSGLIVFATVCVCVVVSSLGSTMSIAFGCTAATAPVVGGVVQQPTRVHELLPKLAPVTAAHWQDRELRVRLCPDVGPMTHETTGFAVLAVGDRTAYTWRPATAPDVPEDLRRYTPPAAEWTDSPAFDAAMGAGTFRFDRHSGTLFFAVSYDH